MKLSPKVVAVGLCWVFAVLVAAAAIDHGHQQERSDQEARFAERAGTSAASVAAYVDDAFNRANRMAIPLATGRVTEPELTRQRATAGFATSSLIDSRGRVLMSSPPGPRLHGTALAVGFAHITSALSGRATVSGVVTSTVGPLVEFAVPINGSDGRVLSSGFAITSSPLSTFVAVPPIAGARGYIIDSDGDPVVVAGDGATADVAVPDTEATETGPVVRGGEVFGFARIDGTPWRVMLTAPVAAVVAPAKATDVIDWSVLVISALAILGALLVLRSVSLSRRVSQEAQRESEQQFRLTVDNAPIGMLLLGLDGRLLRANARFCEMLGYTSDQLVGMSTSDISHADDRAMDAELLQQLVTGKLSHYEREKRYLRSDGEAVWVRLSASLVCDAAGLPMHVVGQSEDITELRAAQAKLEFRALYDSLTGLANRGLLIDRLTLALADHRRDPGTLAVAFCDLDHFKRVNDSLGHHAGDVVLQEVARRLASVVRDGDTVARLGGDEFVVILPRISSIDTAVRVLDRVKKAVEESIEVDGQLVNMSISAGLAVGTAGSSAEMMLSHADRALYAAKDSGRAQYKLYTSAMRSNALLQLSLEQELRRAIVRDEFVLYYQPIVTLSDRRVVGYEGLLRWRHPTRGLLSPASFVDVVEDSNLMGDVGQIVLRQACQFLSRHPSASWRVFVNVSPHQLGRNLSGAVRAELEAAGVVPSRLGLEITENGVLDATGSSLAEMHELRAMGVELLMDDFGTGYSALSSVLTTPITGIKLDQSFTARLGTDNTADRISATVANLVESLGAHGVVEGIENEGQCARALQQGWVHGQGYLFARPAAEAALRLPADDARLLPGALAQEAEPVG